MKTMVLKKKEFSLFKTSVANENDISKTTDLLNIIVGKNQWSFDLENENNVLCINAIVSVNAFLAQELHKLGYECIEL